MTMDYVDGFVCAVPDGNRDAYLKNATEMAAIFKENGAQRVVESWGNDVPEGKITSFSMAVKKEPGETVVFSFVVWPSKQVRDAGWAAMMKDPRVTENTNMPFDGKRLIYGGFQVILDS
jgi:uncharacterized protein YbaA (DUF1428 family)